MDLIAELKKKQMVKEPLIYEEKDGAIEDIISGEKGNWQIYQKILKSLQILPRGPNMKWELLRILLTGKTDPLWPTNNLFQVTVAL